MSALPVQIIRPRLTTREAATTLVTALAVMAIRAWVVMLVAPVVDWHLGYWQAAVLILGIQALLPTRDEYKLWTREAKA